MPAPAAAASYPPPPWHTHGRAWAQPYLVDTRTFDLPPGFTPVAVAGRAVGILGLIEYLPPSPLTYAELIWMPCLVRAAGSRGYFVDKMYVDSEPSLAAGRTEWALPKQLARFAVTATRATVDTEDGAHLVLDLRRRGPGVPVPIAGGTLQHAGDHVVRFRGSGRAHLHSGSIHIVEADGLGGWRGWSTARRIPAAGVALADFAITMHEPRTLG
jgi:Acetoacetate decarboxylase (ADC)